MSVKLKSSAVTISQVKAHSGIFHKLTISGLHCHAESITASFMNKAIRI